MDKRHIIQGIGITIGAVTALALVANNPYHVAALAVGAAVYFFGPKFLK